MNTSSKFKVWRGDGLTRLTILLITAGATAGHAAPANQIWYQDGNQTSSNVLLTTAIDQAAGRLYSGGFLQTADGDSRWYIEARNLADGTPAAGFAGGSLVWDTDNGTAIVPNMISYIGGITTDTQGNVYACGGGCYNGSCAPTQKGNSSTRSNNYDPMMAKFDPTGQRQWVISLDRSSTSPYGDCEEVLAHNESATDFLYTTTETATFNIILAKYNTAGTKIWSKLIDETNNVGIDPAARAMAISDTAVYLAYGGSGFAMLKKYDFNGTLLATRTRTVSTASSEFGLTVARVGGAENVWLVTNRDNRVFRFDADLVEAPTGGGWCHNLDLSAWGTLINVKDLKVVDTGINTYLYIPARKYVDTTKPSDATILRFDMTGGGCVSQNGAGQPFDAADHVFNFGVANSDDAFLPMATDANHDVYVAGFRSVCGPSGGIGCARAVTMKFSGQ